MKPRFPRELGDAMLLACAVTTLVLFVALYTMLPSTSVEIQSVAQTTEPQTINQAK